jgi:hypothetical protein
MIAISYDIIHKFFLPKSEQCGSHKYHSPTSKCAQRWTWNIQDLRNFLNTAIAPESNGSWTQLAFESKKNLKQLQ